MNFDENTLTDAVLARISTDSDPLDRLHGDAHQPRSRYPPRSPNPKHPQSKP